MKTPGGSATGRGVQTWTGSLEHAEHDGADEGEGNVRSNNAQSADERTHEGHWECSLGSRRARKERRKLAKRSRPKKSALLSIPVVHSRPPRETWLKTREINALKSP